MRIRDYITAVGIGLMGAWMLGGRDLLRDQPRVMATRQAIADIIEPGRPLSAAAARRMAVECAVESCR